MILGWYLPLAGGETVGSASRDFNTAEIDFWSSSSVWGRALATLNITENIRYYHQGRKELPPAAVTRRRTPYWRFKEASNWGSQSFTSYISRWRQELVSQDSVWCHDLLPNIHHQLSSLLIGQLWQMSPLIGQSMQMADVQSKMGESENHEAVNINRLHTGSGPDIASHMSLRAQLRLWLG